MSKPVIFLTISSLEDVQNALIQADIELSPKLILSGGSNILFTQHFPGLVIKNEIKGIETIKEDDESIWLKIGAGEVWHDFVLFCVNNHYAGTENLSLIPGSVGAAPIQNIGAYGAELKDIFESLTAIRLGDAKPCTFNKADCQFAYRNSIFKHSHKNQYIVTDVTLRLSKQPNFNTDYATLKNALENKQDKPITIKSISDAVIKIRQQKLPDPKVIGNAGSFFKNPEINPQQFSKLQSQFPNIPSFPTQQAIKIPAAWLIEQCGFKGKRFGDIGVHQHQALVLVNYGNGNGQAIANLAKDIQTTVHNKFDILLEPEVNVI